MIQCWVIEKEPHLDLNVNIPCSFSSCEKLYEIYGRVYGLQWSNYELPINKEERRHYLKQSEILKLSFLSAVRCVDFSKKYEKNDKSLEEQIKLFDTLNPELKERFNIEAYRSHGIRCWAEFWLCKGALEVFAQKKINDPPFEDEFTWWESLLSRQLEDSYRSIGSNPPDRKSSLSLIKKGISDLKNGQKANSEHPLDKLLNLSISICKRKELDSFGTFKRKYWLTYLSTQNDYIKTIKDPKMHPFGMVNEVTVFSMPGNNQSLRAYPAKIFKSGRGRKPQQKPK